MNTIIIELSQEDRARLDAILAALENNKPNCKGCVESAVKLAKCYDPAEEVKNEAEPVEAPAEESITPEPEKPEAPKVERSAVQQKVVELSAAGKREQVREVVMAYASKVSAIPEDKLAEVFEKLTALAG